MEADSNDTMGSIKRKFENNARINPPNSIALLSFAGQELHDSRTLAEYHIFKTSILDLKHRKRTLSIFVEMLPGTTVSLEVDCQDTVEEILRMIMDQDGTSPNQQFLSFEGIQLEAGATMQDYNIKNGCCLKLYLLE